MSKKYYKEIDSVDNKIEILGIFWVQYKALFLDNIEHYNVESYINMLLK